MAYKDNFVVTVFSNGKQLRDTKNHEVYLQFGTEYSINIKNKNGVRSIISLKIDGMDALGGNEVIIPAYSEVTLERFMLDGDKNKGKRFKFVQDNHPDVVNPGGGANGNIEVECWLEIPQYNTTIWYNIPSHSTWTYHASSMLKTMKNTDVSGGGLRYCNYMSQINTDNTNTNNTVQETKCCGAMFMPDSAQAGATIEGNDSNQKFYDAHFGQRSSYSTIISLKLKGMVEPVYVGDTLYCTNCGARVKSDWKFCTKCGNRIELT